MNRFRNVKAIILLLCLAPLLLLPGAGYAQTAASYPLNFSQSWQSVTGFLPGSSTAVTTTDSYVDYIHLANTTSGSVTVTITDNSTHCSAGACQWWPTISIAANTVYVASTGGIYSPGGVKWTCSAATSVVGWIRGKYPVIP